MKFDPLAVASMLFVVCGIGALVAGVGMLAGPALAIITAGVLSTTLGVALAKGWL